MQAEMNTMAFSKKTCKIIKEAIKEEKKGVFDYVKLGMKITQEGTKSDTKIIMKIAQDEAKHEQRLIKIHKKHCRK